MSSAGTALDPIQFGLANIRRSLELIVEYSTQQRLIPIKFPVDDLFDDSDTESALSLRNLKSHQQLYEHI